MGLASEKSRVEADAHPLLEMLEHATSLATLSFAVAKLAGIGSVVRVYQNERLYRFHKKHRSSSERRENGF
jgi:hypothetical protein